MPVKPIRGILAIEFGFVSFGGAYVKFVNCMILLV